MKGTSWGSGFDNYLSSSGLGNTSTPSLGFALQTGSSQSKTLPWVNVNVIEATFNEQPGTINQNSLILSGGTGGSTPSVTGFSQLSSTTYAWTLLSTALTANRLEISFQASGANAVTDANQAGLSGNWTGGTSAFPSGNGLAGTTSSSDFNFLFNSLPGERAARRHGGQLDRLPRRASQEQHHDHQHQLQPLLRRDGAGVINSTDYLDVRARNNNTLPANAPGPQDSGVGSLGSDDAADVGGAMLAVQEGSTSQIGATGDGGEQPDIGQQQRGLDGECRFQWQQFQRGFRGFGLIVIEQHIAGPGDRRSSRWASIWPTYGPDSSGHGIGQPISRGALPTR